METFERKTVMKTKTRVVTLVILFLISVSCWSVLAQSTVMDLMKEGSAFYIRNDFKQAIGPYSKALELEKKQAILSKTLWYVLVDNLGIAYGVTGDLKKSKETFEYGLSKDSKYPLFYYNLACTYAEMNDLDQAIPNLKHAFEYKANVIPGEMVPDPATDDSFQRFMKNDRFLAALKEIKK